MRAWRMPGMGPLTDGSLRLDRLPCPRPGPDELLLRVLACGVCHTELDEIEGRAPPPRLPVTPGHQVIGTVVACGPDCAPGWLGQSVGVAWILSACGNCPYCREGRENLCADFRGCGRDADGGYAEYMVVCQDFAHLLPQGLDAVQAAPLLCAGAVGLRAIRLCGLKDGEPIALTGFGASGHLMLPMLKHLYPASPVAVLARSAVERAFALELGADWAGDTWEPPPWPLQAVIDTTPAWAPMVAALESLAPGGCLVINAIAKEASDHASLLKLDYPRHLWREKVLRTVTNVTRQDVRDCLALAVEIPLRPLVTEHPLEAAHQALRALRMGGNRGAQVLVMPAA